MIGFNRRGDDNGCQYTKMFLCTVALALGVEWAGVSAVRGEGVGAKGYRIQETRAWEVEAGAKDFLFSEDGRHVAYVARKGGKEWAVVDGKAGAAFDEVPEYPLVFSPDGRHVAHQARKGAKWVVVEDNREGDEFDGILEGTPKFSVDSKRMAYAVKQGGKERVVVDGKAQAEYDRVPYFGAPHFTPDGKHVAYIAKMGKTQVVVIDGREGPAYDAVGWPTFSADGNRVAYRGMRGGKPSLVLDGQEKAWIEGMADGSLVFSPDGKGFTYTAKRGGKMKLVVNGEEGPGYSGLGRPIFSTDGARIAYEAITVDWRGAKPQVEVPAKEGQWAPINVPDGVIVKSRMVVNGKEGAAYDGLSENVAMGLASPPIFSADGKHLAYAARKGEVGKGERWLVVVDEREGPEFDAVMMLTFSPDGKHVAYTAQRGGKWLVVVDGKAMKDFSPAGNVEVGTVALARDGGHLAYSAKNDGKWRVVVDGMASEGFEAVGGPAFDADGKLECLGVKGDAIYRITWVAGE